MDNENKQRTDEIIDQIKELVKKGNVARILVLRGEDTEVQVIRWNRRLRVVGKVFPYEHSWDEKILLTIREADLFTEAERTENYINYFHKYPAWYTGRRDEAMLARMTQDMDFDPKTQTYREPFGRMVDGDFVYMGETRAIRLA